MTHPARLAPLPLPALPLIALACLLTGCSLPLPDKPQRPQPYDLGAPLAAPQGSASAASATALAIARPSAPPAIDGTALIYRLMYVQGGLQPRPYAQASWTMAPPQLLGQRLRETIAATRPVVDANRGLAPVELHIELEEFAQLFTAPGASEGAVRLRATAIAPGAQPRLLGQRTFSARHPAPTADAPGGVAALRAASDEVTTQITTWINQLAPPN